MAARTRPSTARREAGNGPCSANFWMVSARGIRSEVESRGHGDAGAGGAALPVEPEGVSGLPDHEGEQTVEEPGRQRRGRSGHPLRTDLRKRLRPKDDSAGVAQ